MSPRPAFTKQQLETKLIEKAWKDPAFREQVVRDPKGMLEQYLGKELPAGIKIFVHEDDAQTLHLAIPPAPSNISELSDDDLEKVAGGTEFFIVMLGVTTALATAGAAVSATVSAAVGGGLATGGVANPW